MLLSVVILGGDFEDRAMTPLLQHEALPGIKLVRPPLRYRFPYRASEKHKV